MPESVKNHYLRHPYPPRSPDDEKHRLLGTVLDYLPLINFYGYSGLLNTASEFRCLVAGAGTGDAVLHLAEQLRQTDNTVVYLDMSRESMAIAKERAKVRSLSNITWVEGSLLDLPQMDLGEFDFINCSGVLHHLDDRQAGLDALTQMLKPAGLMAIMVYSRHMRAALYQMQELLRLLNGSEQDHKTRLNVTKNVLSQLPKTNLFRMHRLRFESELQSGDAAIADLLLHPVDQPFSVPEIYRWLDESKLKLIEFVSPIGQKFFYQPENLMSGEALKKARQLGRRDQHAVADLFSLASANHAFYCAKKVAPLPDPSDPDMVPFLFPHMEKTQDLSQELATELKRSEGGSFDTQLSMGGFSIPATPVNQALISLIDGQRTVGEICHLAAQRLESSTEAMHQDFVTLFNVMNCIDWLLLRHKSVPGFFSSDELHRLWQKSRL